MHLLKSTPDYRWPAEMLSARSAPRRWLLAGVFYFAYVLGRIVSLLKPNRPAVLMIRTDGLGDALLAEPMLVCFSRRFSSHQLHLWMPKTSCDLFRAWPFAKRRLSIPRGFKSGNIAYFNSPVLRAKLGYSIGRWRFECAAYVVESPEPLGNWLLRSVRAKQRWYAPGSLENQFESQQEKTVWAATLLLRSRGVGEHELKRNHQFAEQWDETADTSAPVVYLDSKDDARAQPQIHLWRKAANTLGAVSIVGLMPASSMAVKGYPLGSWASAARKLWEEDRVVCALLGGSSDSAALDQLGQLLCDVPHLRLQKPLDILGMAALLSKLDGLLSVDTGLAHIALSFGLPSVILRSGGHPNRFFPWPGDTNSITLTHTMPCQGCKCRCTLAEAECLTRISPESIVSAFRSLSGGQKIRKQHLLRGAA